MAVLVITVLPPQSGGQAGSTVAAGPPPLPVLFQFPKVGEQVEDMTWWVLHAPFGGRALIQGIEAWPHAAFPGVEEHG